MFTRINSDISIEWVFPNTYSYSYYYSILLSSPEGTVYLVLSEKELYPSKQRVHYTSSDNTKGKLFPREKTNNICLVHNILDIKEKRVNPLPILTMLTRNDKHTVHNLVYFMRGKSCQKYIKITRENILNKYSYCGKSFQTV